MASKKRKQKPEDPNLKTLKALGEELDAIKRLLIVLLLKISTSQGEVAKALRTDQANVSRMFAARQIKKIDTLKLFDEKFWKKAKKHLK